VRELVEQASGSAELPGEAARQGGQLPDLADVQDVQARAVSCPAAAGSPDRGDEFGFPPRGIKTASPAWVLTAAT
jgi:hypothetical protein